MPRKTMTTEGLRQRAVELSRRVAQAQQNLAEAQLLGYAATKQDLCALNLLKLRAGVAAAKYAKRVS